MRSLEANFSIYFFFLLSFGRNKIARVWRWIIIQACFAFDFNERYELSSDFFLPVFNQFPLDDTVCNASCANTLLPIRLLRSTIN